MGACGITISVLVVGAAALSRSDKIFWWLLGLLLGALSLWLGWSLADHLDPVVPVHREDQELPGPGLSGSRREYPFHLHLHLRADAGRTGGTGAGFGFGRDRADPARDARSKASAAGGPDEPFSTHAAGSIPGRNSPPLPM